MSLLKLSSPWITCFPFASCILFILGYLTGNPAHSRAKQAQSGCPASATSLFLSHFCTIKAILFHSTEINATISSCQSAGGATPKPPPGVPAAHLAESLKLREAPEWPETPQRLQEPPQLLEGPQRSGSWEPPQESLGQKKICKFHDFTATSCRGVLKGHAPALYLTWKVSFCFLIWIRIQNAAGIQVKERWKVGG